MKKGIENEFRMFSLCPCDFLFSNFLQPPTNMPDSERTILKFKLALGVYECVTMCVHGALQGLQILLLLFYFVKRVFSLKPLQVLI